MPTFSTASARNRSGGLHGDGNHSPAAAVDTLSSILWEASTGGWDASAAEIFRARSLSLEAMDVVSGLMKAFMGTLQLDENQTICLNNSVHNLTDNITGPRQDILLSINTLMESDPGNAEEGPAQVVETDIDSASHIKVLVTLSAQILKNCVRVDAVEMLRRAGRHLVSARYMGHQLFANGIQIAHGFAKIMSAFRAKEFDKLGRAIGRLLRKFLLSNASSGSSGLSKAIPEKDLIDIVIEGVMTGFFVQGSELDIQDTSDPDVRIILKLHQCMSGNSVFFKDIWNRIWKLFVELSLNQQQHDLGALLGVELTSHSGRPPGQPSWAGELIMVFVRFPTALHRCGIGSSTQTMFVDAADALKHIKANAVLPYNGVHGANAPDKIISRAVAAWTDLEFRKFGQELGALLRELVMLEFPKKYSVDSAGRLRRKFSRDSGKMLGFLPDALDDKQSRSMFGIIVGCCALSILVGLVAVRSVWSISRKYSGRHIPSANRTPAVWSHETTGRQLSRAYPCPPPPSPRLARQLLV